MPHHRVAVLGLGYVGLPLAVAATLAGHEVVGFDVDRDRIRMLDAGRTGIENVGDVELEKALASDRLRLTDRTVELAGCDAYVICVPTPLTDRAPDLSMVTAAVDAVAANLTPGDLVILESTTYPGTTEELVASRITAATGLVAPRDYYLAFSPERIDPGNPVFGLGNTPKVVGGVGRASTRVAARFYRSFVDRVHVVSRPREAEMAKLLENTFRHINIALVNELAILCRELGIDLWEAIDAAATKPFGFMPFHPGPGVGGHCIPVDPAYLSWRIRRLGYSFRFVELAEEINDRMPEYVVSRIAEQLDKAHRSLRGASVLVLGVTYKPDVADLRESPAFPVVRRLIARGARVAWHDPHAAHFEVDSVPLPRIRRLTPAALSAQDLVLIHTDHSCYDWQLVVANAELVFDARNATDGIRSAQVTRL